HDRPIIKKKLFLRQSNFVLGVVFSGVLFTPIFKNNIFLRTLFGHGREHIFFFLQVLLGVAL
ncbi:hypothetical protein ACJX0J_010394, partial [Zea mays]